VGLISPETIERIRTASDIVEVVGGYIPLKRAGANFVALCPFHKEKTPSFHVNPSRQIFHCFGCHKGGDVFRFVQEYEGLDFIEAVKRLAERARIPIEFDQQPGYRESRQTKETLFKIHEQIAQRWHHALINEAAGQPAREYLAKRQVPAEAVELFRLGYAPDLWDDTVNWAKSKGFDLALMEQAGLVIRKEQSDHYYDRFRGRLSSLSAAGLFHPMHREASTSTRLKHRSSQKERFSTVWTSPRGRFWIPNALSFVRGSWI